MIRLIFVTPQFKNGGGNRVFVELANIICQNNNYIVEISYPNNSLEINHYKLNERIRINRVGKYSNNLLIKLFNTILLFKYLIKGLKHDNKLLVSYTDGSNTGWNAQNAYKQIELNMEDVEKLDNGLNSPWKIYL